MTTTTMSRWMNDDEVTLAQAVRILGLSSAQEAARYINSKRIDRRKALPDRLSGAVAEQVYLRTDIERLAQHVEADMAAKLADQAARRLANLQAVHAAKKVKAEQDALAPYVKIDEAATITGRSTDDLLFDDEDRLAFYTDPEGVRWFARDDLAAFTFTEQQRSAEERAERDMRSVIQAFTRQAEEARAAQSRVEMLSMREAEHGEEESDEIVNVEEPESKLKADGSLRSLALNPRSQGEKGGLNISNNQPPHARGPIMDRSRGCAPHPALRVLAAPFPLRERGKTLIGITSIASITLDRHHRHQGAPPLLVWQHPGRTGVLCTLGTGQR